MENSERSLFIDKENQELKLKKRLEIIEKSSLDFLDRDDYKLDLTLLVLDKKRVAYFSNAEIAETEVEKSEKIKKLASELEKLKKFFDELEVFCSDAKVQAKGNLVFYKIYASKDEECLDEFVESEKREDDKRKGLLLGYPKTSVDAFGTDEEMDFDELPEKEREELVKEGVVKFLTFSPSRSHWKEEFEQARENQRLIKEKAPGIYGEIMNSDTDFYLKNS